MAAENPPRQLYTPAGRDPGSCYPMKRPYGFALVVNIKCFKGTTENGETLKEREGSDVDVRNLKDLWEQLGFTVERHEDLKAHEICTVVLKMARKIDRLQTSSCFVCCIMTHGDMGVIYGSDCKSVNINYIIDQFKQAQCKALAEKPKLFFLQACRGSQSLNASTNDSTNEATGSTNAATSSQSPSNKTGARDKPTSGTGLSKTQILDTGSSAETTSTATSTNEATSEKGNSPTITLTGSNEECTKEGTNTRESWSIVEAECDVEFDQNDKAFFQSAEPDEYHFLLGYSTAPGK